jgi:L-ascorbate metabolism protein UlaG (beta-lactamase superfamily)
MDACRLTLAANTGFAVEFGGLRFLYDVLTTADVPGFSHLTPARWEALQRHPAFRDPDFILNSHNHVDHYDPKLTEQAKLLWPDSRIISPDPEIRPDLLLSGGGGRFLAGNVSVRFFRLPHDGKQFADTLNYGFLLEKNNRHVLFTGDCAVASPELARQLDGNFVHLAVLNFPWMTLRAGREFTDSFMHPAHVALCHLPFPEDDVYHYLEATRKDTSRYSQGKDFRIFSSFLQVENFSL